MAAQIVAHHQQQVLPDLETLRDQNTELAAQNAELAAQHYELAAAVKSIKVEAEANLNNHFDQLMNYLRKEIVPRLNSLFRNLISPYLARPRRCRTRTPLCLKNE